jgi:ABC-type uncharacterized transport system permease subunit
MMAKVTVFCFLASYAVAFALELHRLLRRSSISRYVMLLFGAAGFVAHTAFLWVRSDTTGYPPLLSSARDWVLVLAWVAILLYLFLTVLDRELALGLFILPLVLILIASARFFSDQTNSKLSDQVQNWAMLHASSLVFGIASVIVGFVLSMMYLVQHRRLKHKLSLKDGLALPNLARLARWNKWAVMVSVPLLAIGLLTGICLGFMSQSTLGLSLADPIVIGNGVVWLLMVGMVVWLAVKKSPTGKQVAWLTMSAFGFLLVTLISTQVITNAMGGSLGSLHR